MAAVEPLRVPSILVIAPPRKIPIIVIDDDKQEDVNNSLSPSVSLQPTGPILDQVGVSLSDDRQTLAVGARINSLVLRGVGTPRQAVVSRTDYAGNATGAALSAGGAVSALSGLYGIMLSERSEVVVTCPGRAVSIALSADGATLVSAWLLAPYAAGRVTVTAADDTGLKASWLARLHFGQCAVAVSGNGRRVAHAFAGGARVIDAARGGSVVAECVARGSVDVALDAAGVCAAVADEDSLRVKRCGAAAGQEQIVQFLSYAPPPYSPAVIIAGDGSCVAAFMCGGRYGVFSAESGKLLLYLDGQPRPSVGVSMSHDGGVAAAAAPPESVHVWRTRSVLCKLKSGIRKFRSSVRDSYI